MAKNRHIVQRGFIDPLSLFSLGFLVVSLITATVVINKNDANFNPFNRASEIDCESLSPDRCIQDDRCEVKTTTTTNQVSCQEQDCLDTNKREGCEYNYTSSQVQEGSCVCAGGDGLRATTRATCTSGSWGKCSWQISTKTITERFCQGSYTENQTTQSCITSAAIPAAPSLIPTPTISPTPTPQSEGNCISGGGCWLSDYCYQHNEKIMNSRNQTNETWSGFVCCKPGTGGNYNYYHNYQGENCGDIVPTPASNINACIDPCSQDSECGTGSYCYKPATGCPVCKPKGDVCIPESKQCSGNLLQVCNSYGTSWQSQDCGSIGCNPTTKECNQPIVTSCITLNQACSPTLPCCGSLTCVRSQYGSYCGVRDGCTQGETKCVEEEGGSRIGYIYTCNSNGLYNKTQRCDNGCNGTSCSTNVCTEGEKRCKSDHTALETCVADGAAWKAESCLYGCENSRCNPPPEGAITYPRRCSSSDPYALEEYRNDNWVRLEKCNEPCDPITVTCGENTSTLIVTSTTALKQQGEPCQNNSECASNQCARSYVWYGEIITSADQLRCVPSLEVQDATTIRQNQINTAVTGVVATLPTAIVTLPTTAATLQTIWSISGNKIANLPTASYLYGTNALNSLPSWVTPALEYAGTVPGLYSATKCNLYPELCTEADQANMFYTAYGIQTMLDQYAIQNIASQPKSTSSWWDPFGDTSGYRFSSAPNTSGLNLGEAIDYGNNAPTNLARTRVGTPISVQMTSSPQLAIGTGSRVQLENGQEIEVGEALGHGGGGTAYLSTNTCTSTRCVVKIPNNPSDPIEGLQSLQEESEFLQQVHTALTEANLSADIVNSYGMVTQQGQTVGYAMEYIPGMTLEKGLSIPETTLNQLRQTMQNLDSLGSNYRINDIYLNNLIVSPDQGTITIIDPISTAHIERLRADDTLVIDGQRAGEVIYHGNYRIIPGTENSKLLEKLLMEYHIDAIP